MDNHFLHKKALHDLFEATVFIKGINGCWEIVVGILFFFFKTQTISHALISFSGYDIVKDSGQVTTNYLINQANHFSLSTKYFIAFYFGFYGVVNIFLVVALLRGKLWAYPAAIVFFIFFIIYQIYRFYLHRSGLLLFFTLFDIFLVFLTWLEYKRVTAKKATD